MDYWWICVAYFPVGLDHRLQSYVPLDLFVCETIVNNLLQWKLWLARIL